MAEFAAADRELGQLEDLVPWISFPVAPRVWATVGGRLRSGSIGLLLGVVLVVGIIVMAFTYALSLVGHVLGVTPTFGELNQPSRWLNVRYPDTVLRYLLVADLVLTVALLGAALRAKPRRALAVGEPEDSRRWVHVIESTCPTCGTVDERAGGVHRCPTCGTEIPDEQKRQTGGAILER